MTRLLAFALTACLFGLAACAPFPEIAASQADSGTYPTLLPIDGLLAQADQAPTDPAPALAARAAALKTRAAALGR